MSRASTKAQAPGGRPPDDQESLRTLHHAFDVLEPGSSRSLAEAAARFSLSNPTVSSIIPGARSPQEAEWAMHAWQRGPLPEPEVQRLQEWWQRELRPFIRTAFAPSPESNLLTSVFSFHTFQGDSHGRYRYS